MKKILDTIKQDMITYFGNDCKRINHALKVHSFACTIGLQEQISSDLLFNLELASILHDIGIKISEEKYNSSAGKYQEIEGPPIAKEILLRNNIDNEIIERVCFLIGNHHTPKKIDALDFQILMEADALVNIFEDNYNSDMIRSVKTKLFKTFSGIQLLTSMYL